MSSDSAHPPVESWRQIAALTWDAAVVGLLTVLALLPLTLGFLAGVAWWALRWLAAAVVVGFQAGNRQEDDTE